MRNEHLKDELNELPQDFDQEQLWASIDLPKKKKKRQGIFWMIGLAGVLIVGVIIYNSGLEINDDQSAPLVSEQNSSSQANDITSLQSDQNQISKKEEIAGTELQYEDQNSKIESNLEIGKIQYDNKEDSNNNIHENLNFNFSRPKILAEKPRLIQGFGVEKNTNSSSFNDGNINQITTKDLLKLNKDINDLETINPLLKSNIVTYLDISHLPILAFTDFFKTQKNEDLYIGNPKVNKVISSNSLWHIDVMGLYGFTNHDFGNSSTSSDRLSNEKTLESITIGVLSRLDVDRFQFSAGISSTRHNTVYSKKLTDYAVVNSISGLTQKNIIAKYSLYNYYQTIDVNLGFGYEIILSDKWSLVPTLFVNHALHVKSDGEIINDDKGLIKIEDIEAYDKYSKWQGQFSLKLNREINKNWGIGFVTFINTKRPFATMGEYSHEINAFGIGLSLSKTIK